jgi:hypothetical protein
MEMQFEYDESAYDFYNAYNKRIGFGIHHTHKN